MKIIGEYAEIAAYYIVIGLHRICYAAYWLLNRFIWLWYGVSHNHVEPLLERWRNRLIKKYYTDESV